MIGIGDRKIFSSVCGSPGSARTVNLPFIAHQMFHWISWIIYSLWLCSVLCSLLYFSLTKAEHWILTRLRVWERSCSLSLSPSASGGSLKLGRWKFMHYSPTFTWGQYRGRDNWSDCFAGDHWLRSPGDIVNIVTGHTLGTGTRWAQGRSCQHIQPSDYRGG